MEIDLLLRKQLDLFEATTKTAAYTLEAQYEKLLEPMQIDFLPQIKGKKKSMKNSSKQI
jgi:hypothetical protein